MNRRNFLTASIVGILGAGAGLFFGRDLRSETTGEVKIKKIFRTDREWKKILSKEQYRVLRKEGTEKPFTSPLLDNKSKGLYVCAGCELPLFTSEMKYDSGTGWPSFKTTLPGAIETKKDFKLIYLRTEYHCYRCGGHQGHVFDDGPPPTRQRWCNNGVALKFIPDSA